MGSQPSRYGSTKRTRAPFRNTPHRWRRWFTGWCINANQRSCPRVISQPIWSPT